MSAFDSRNKTGFGDRSAKTATDDQLLIKDGVTTCSYGPKKRH